MSSEHLMRNVTGADQDQLNNMAIDNLAGLMKAKMFENRLKGKVLWYSKLDVEAGDISKLFAQALHSGNTIAAANYLMMLHHRQELVQIPEVLEVLFKELNQRYPEETITQLARDKYNDYFHKCAADCSMEVWTKAFKAGYKEALKT